MKKTVVLAILDGWGIGHKDATNPIHLAQPANINYFKQNFLSGALQASGIAVGLPWGEEGNSEVGHLTIGAGKILYQHYPRISLAIKDGSFFKNAPLLQAFDHAQKQGSAVNLIGLLTEGNVHASFEHLEALIKFAKQAGVQKLNLHLETDGKDSSPQSALLLLARLRKIIAETKLGTIGSISGRYYALDRDGHYDRTEKAYRAITGQGPQAESAEDWVQKNYAQKLDDQFIEPATLSPDNVVKPHDAIIFFDFREDSVRQLAEAFSLPSFSQFPIIENSQFFAAAFTRYSPKLNCLVAFPEESVKQPLGWTLAKHGKIQLRVAETEKYAHVTYFFNGFRDEPFPNEYRVLIPSQNVARHDEHPAMMAKEIVSRVIQAVQEGGTDFILLNIANADTIAHTGNFEAALIAVNTIDAEIRRLFDAVMVNDAVLIVASDHGNIEQMADPLTGIPETHHNISPVPIYIIGKDFVSVKTPEAAEVGEHEALGLLSDIAPTVLDIMGLPKPEEMTGESLLKILK